MCAQYCVKGMESMSGVVASAMKVGRGLNAVSLDINVKTLCAAVMGSALMAHVCALRVTQA